MSRATELFNRLRDRGCSALDELLDDREPESLFLDFKRSPDDGSGRLLASEDNKNLSKAISGFANSSGGVVVWGVDCHRDSVTGSEVAQKHPLLDASGFGTKLQGAISRTTMPPHPGVQVFFFDEPGRTPVGYVAVLVPQSIIGPIRSVWVISCFLPVRSILQADPRQTPSIIDNGARPAFWAAISAVGSGCCARALPQASKLINRNRRISKSNELVRSVSQVNAPSALPGNGRKGNKKARRQAVRLRAEHY